MTPEQAAAATAVYAQHGVISIAEARQELGSIEQKRRDQDLRAHRVLDELMQRVPVNIRIGSWDINSGKISVHINGYGLSDHEVRGRVMLLAEQFNLGYTEYPLAVVPAENRVCTTGDYKDVSVRFWSLVSPCHCEDCEAGR